MSKKLLNLCMTALFGAVSTAAWALSDVNGVYQISSAADWEAFAALVNGGEVNACAVLTDDIDTGIDGTMIGVADAQGQRYDGTFDGQGHTIKINLFPEVDYTGIFRYIGWRAVIQNLKVEGTITTESKFAGGIVGCGRGVIRNCWSEVTIKSNRSGDATHGGISGYGFSGTVIENCLVKTVILGESTQNCGGVVGWASNPVNIVNCLVVSDGNTIDVTNGLSRNIARNDSRVVAIDVATYNQDIYANRPGGACYNNYVTTDWEVNASTHNPSVTIVPFEDLADGRICYQLNNDQSRIGWVQTIGTDPFPVPAPFGNVQTGRVYASAATDCDGKIDGTVLTFSNSGTAMATEHRFDKYGVCSVCGCFNFNYFDLDDPTKFDQADRAVLLKSKEDFDVVEGMNRVCNGFKLNMKMANDISYIAEPGQLIFNPSDWVDGNFNGDGHALTIQISNIEGNNAAFIPQMDGNVENLILHGSIGFNGQFAGSITGEARMGLVRNVFCDIDMNSDRNGDNSSGGFFGRIRNAMTVENCIYAGDFNTPRDPESGAGCVRIGGFAGWANAKTNFNNCALLGHLNGAGGSGDIENSQHFTRNPGNAICDNCYVVNPIEGPDVGDYDKFTVYENKDGIASGELAFFLNGKQGGVERFYQLIGTDPEPMPIKKEGALVYASSGQYQCDGTPIGDGVSYTNNASGGAVIPPHTFVDGFCTVCGQIQDNYLTSTDGFLEINNGYELVWFSKYAAQHPDACAKLMGDIDMSNYNNIFTPIGSEAGSALYAGEFDGQRHTISNLIISNNGNYQGLFGLIGDGANIHDFVLDETCSIYAANYAGIIGGTSGSGNIYVTNVGFEGQVGTGTRNAAGIVGCDGAGAMDMFITNCWVTGTITGGVESGAICGYSSSGSVVKNCWSTCQMPSTSIWSSDSFTRGGATTINCYEADIEGVEEGKQQHYKPMADNRKVSITTTEEVANGALCYKLNGSQFLDPVIWYQTLDEDVHPYPYNDHGLVIFGADQYFSIPGATLSEVISTIQATESEVLQGEIIATQSLVDALAATVEALTNVDSLEGLAEALAAIAEAKQAVATSEAAYKAYIEKCEETKTYLAEHTDFEGDLRDSLAEYLDVVGEPGGDNTLGTYEYIVYYHTATTEEIVAETERVVKWLQEAITTGYTAGTDVTSLFNNADFSQKNESWTGGWANDWDTFGDEQSKTVGVEAWNVTGDMYQTVEGMKPGYYLVGINGAFRPSNNRYSYNYAAGIYANGIFNYFPAIIEDAVPVEEAVDNVNCNISIKSSYDFAIYEDGYSTDDTNGSDIISYAVQGPYGMAIAASVNRYQAYTIAKVGEDGKLTVGIKNPGTKYSRDWTGWGPLKVVYYADEADAALDKVIANMNDRAESIINMYEYIDDMDDEDVYGAPNYPEELKNALIAAQGKIADATTTEAKAALVEEFSDLFQRIYEGKQAYLNMIDVVYMLENLELGNMALVEKNEDGDWEETGYEIFSFDEINNLIATADDLRLAYMNGSYSTAEALNPSALASLSDIIPAKDEDGYYLIGTQKQFAGYRAIASEINRYAKGKLIADVDMTGVAMLPIGHNRGENAQHIFMGEFDGQGHALTNVYIDDANIPSGEYAEPATLFYELQNATVKNLKLTGEMFTTHQFSGPLTRWMAGKSTIDNCEIAVAFHLGENLAGDASSGGLIGRNGSANSLVSNCLVNTKLIGEGDGPIWYVGGVAGWADAALVIKNTLILSEYTNVGAEGDNSQTIARGAGASATNVFVSQFFRGQQGTLVTPEQLASGETTWKLNGSTGEDVHWFQTLGVEATPHLFGGDVVYYYGGQYVNEKPNPQLNAFAYNLTAGLNKGNVVVKFDLNAEAEAAEVQFYNGETLVYTKSVEAELTAGSYSVAVPASELGDNPLEVNYKVSVTGKGSKEVLRVGEPYTVWGPHGLAVNNNPASKNFGQVLVAESYLDSPATGYISSRKSGALFAFDPSFQPVNSADGTPGFYGGLDIAGETPLSIASNLQFEFKDLRFTEDGRLFIARASGLSNSSVWEINPDNLNEAWKPVFTGGELDEATGITYVGEEEQNRMALGLAFEGKGEDLTMYVLGGQAGIEDPVGVEAVPTSTRYNCSIYELGTAKTWATAPSASFEPLNGLYTSTVSYVGIHEDGQGGLWFIQSVGSPSAESPAIKHFDTEGNEDYSNTSITTSGGRIATSPDGQYLAIPNGSGKVVLYQCDYVPMENGRISLQPKATINVAEPVITGMAFDWANNLYVASEYSETFSRYTIPGMNKVVVTPGNGIITRGDVNIDGQVDIADAVTVLNAMAGQQVKGDADVNGDGQVDIADFVTILNIMAGQ